jgi:excisionase family DNA binding protein
MDIAKALSISRAYAYRLVMDGTIPSIRIGRSVRVRPIDLQAFIDENIKGLHPTDRSVTSTDKNLNKTLY